MQRFFLEVHRVRSRESGRLRHWISAALFLWLTPILAVGAGGLGLTLVPSIAAGGLAAVIVAAAASRRIASALATKRSVPFLFRLALGATAVVAIIQFASVSVFMGDVIRVGFSTNPDDRFRRVHSCTTAYAEAARFLGAGASNIYERTLYRGPAGEFRWMGPLTVDPFHYPPMFLLLPQAVRVLAPDFWDFRRIWFTFQALVLVGAIVGLAAWIGGQPGTIALLGGLLLLAFPNVPATLQQGNFQITAVPLAISGFVLVMSGRTAVGGGLLAYTALAKIFPGILVVSLMAGRRWRALAWTAAVGMGLLTLTFALQGLQPARDFLSTSLPEISSGDAFPQTELPPHSRVNWSAYGQTVRLRQLGLTWLTQSYGLLAAQVYGLVVVALAAWAGWRGRFDVRLASGRMNLLQLGLALVSLASFRSPFVGGLYGAFSTLWVMTLFAARAPSPVRTVIWLASTGALTWAIWLVPSPATPYSQLWVWITGVLVLACMIINVFAVVLAVRLPAAARASAEMPAPAAT